jgi:hypothetical protein
MNDDYRFKNRITKLLIQPIIFEGIAKPILADRYESPFKYVLIHFALLMMANVMQHHQLLV